MMLVEQNARSRAWMLADFGYVMEIGRIVMDGSADRLMESDDIKDFYLGHQEGGANAANGAGSARRRGGESGRD